MKAKALFLDRDGVINVDKKYVHKIEDFEFFDEIFELCELFLKKSYLIFVVTNQSGIARGYYTESDFQKLTSFMCAEFLKRGIKISKVYHCPHLQGCLCRKPEAGMLLKAKDEFDINMSKSAMIGDNISDMQAGKKAGLKDLFLLNEDESLKKDDFYKKFANLAQLLAYLKGNK